jgi:hypothetical protein
VVREWRCVSGVCAALTLARTQAHANARTHSRTNKDARTKPSTAAPRQPRHPSHLVSESFSIRVIEYPSHLVSELLSIWVIKHLSHSVSESFSIRVISIRVAGNVCTVHNVRAFAGVRCVLSLSLSLSSLSLSADFTLTRLAPSPSASRAYVREREWCARAHHSRTATHAPLTHHHSRTTHARACCSALRKYPSH